MLSAVFLSHDQVVHNVVVVSGVPQHKSTTVSPEIRNRSNGRRLVHLGFTDLALDILTEMTASY